MRNIKKAKITAALTLAVAVAACSSDPEAEETPGEADEGGKVSGDVLGGSISDAMLPLDQLRSQSPAERDLPPQADGAETEAPEAEAGSDTEASASDAPAAVRPARPAPPPAQAAPSVAPPLQVAPPVDDASGD